MSALVTFLAFAVSAAAPPATLRAVVMPLRLPEHAGADLQSASPGVERAFADALARHAAFKVMARAEVSAVLGSAARDQLAGCDADSCMAEIADALGADLVITAQADRAGGLWNLRASLLDRAQAAAIRRAAVSARALDGLLTSVDTLARQLVGGSAVVLEDPRLAQRLGTTPEGAAELAAAARANPGQDVGSLWTDLVVQRNRESEGVALLEGGYLVGVGAALALYGVVTAPLSVVYPTAVENNGPPAFPESGKTYGNGDGTYNFPLLAALLYWTTWLVPVVAVPVLLAPWAALVLVDRLDRGRLPVQRNGCCRDETRVRATESPGWGRRLAPLLAALGGGLALSAPVVGMLAVLPFAFGAGMSGGVPAGPTVRVPGTAYVALLAFSYLVISPVNMAGLVAVASLCLGSAVVLMANERSTLTDD